MNRIQEVFGRPKVVLPVIHVKNLDHAIRNTDTVMSAGAKGLFLINHHISATKLDLIRLKLQDLYPEYWFGINYLGLPRTQALGHTIHGLEQNWPKGLWFDNAGIKENVPIPDGAARETHTLLSAMQWGGLLFGGVAFKHQPEVSNLPFVAQLAAKYVDVVTTSGEATGSAPGIEKLKIIRGAIGPEKPLANASGTTLKNAAQFFEVVDVLIASTYFSRDDEEDELDGNKIEQAVRIEETFIH